MPDASSAITNIQKLIKQLSKDALQQIQKTHAEPLSRIHQIMRENGLTPDTSVERSSAHPKINEIAGDTFLEMDEALLETSIEPNCEERF